MFVKFPLADTVEEAPRLATRSLRKVSRPEPAPDVPVVLLDELDALFDELLPEASWIADTRLLKSDFSVSRLLPVEAVEEVEEVSPNSEIRFSILLAKLE
ncbi:MAG: hypothetical protein ACLQBD_00405 [Syntrophobacteraceae bacterium]